ncbi:MAG: hypothetical protein EPO68_17770 [Planctomycetota bacterium]|nr:MAG: hypothetical protein EPO68_17770 [Planctomycetota bacterium]
MLLALLASNVLVVAPTAGPGVDFTSIQAAIDTAASGDIVLVRAGTYGESIAIPAPGKSLSIVGDAAIPPRIRGLLDFGGVAAEHVIALRGLELAGVVFEPPATQPTVRIGAGTLLVEDCNITGSRSGIQAFSSRWTGVTRCTIRATSTALYQLPPLFSYAVQGLAVGAEQPGSTLTIHASSIFGAPAVKELAVMGFYGAPGREAVNSATQLLVSRTALTGGDGLPTSYYSFGLCVPHDPGPGLSYTGSSHVLASTIHAGASGLTSPPCPQPQPVPDIIGAIPSLLGGDSPVLGATPVVREGQTLHVSLESTPNDYAFVFVASSMQPQWVDAYVGVLAGQIGQLFALGTVGAAGSASGSATILDLGAGVEGAVVYLQGASIDPATLSVRLSNVSVATLLDAGL